MTTPLLRVSNLRVSLLEDPDQVPVDDVSFDVGPGESVALVGESGCGKSVSSYSVLGLLESSLVAQGSMEFDGRSFDLGDIGSLTPLRGTEIAMIPQDPGTSLNPVVTIARQLGDLVRIHQGVSKQVSSRRVRELLARVGIPAPEWVARAYPFELSGGMRQRVLIAMALACEPKLLIADEPTTALDTTVQAQIMDLLDTLIRDEDMSMLFISHDLGLVAQHSTRIYVMYAGRIVESGTIDDVLGESRHPYTSALIGCLDSMNSGATRLQTVPGIVPALADRRGGCQFAPRCDRSSTECFAQEPQLAFMGASRVACHHPIADESARRSTIEVLP